MSGKTLPFDGAQCFRAVLGLLLALILWTGNRLICRVDALETNQIRILVHMGLEPDTAQMPPKSGHRALAGAVPDESRESNTKKSSPRTWTILTPCRADPAGSQGQNMDDSNILPPTSEKPLDGPHNPP